jgi:hypothetical protein
MLVGFGVWDEAGIKEVCSFPRRLFCYSCAHADICAQLPRLIFAIADEPPAWPGADDEMGLESVSDPEEVEDLGADSRDVSNASHVPSSSASHVAASPFSHTHAHHKSNSTTHSVGTSSSGGARSEEVDTEEDPVTPITPLHCARFDLSGGPPQQQPGKDKSREKGTVGDAYAELEGDNGFVDAGGEVEIEDDWVDPVTPPPAPAPARAKKGSKGKSKGKKKAVPVSAEDGSGEGLSGLSSLRCLSGLSSLSGLSGLSGLSSLSSLSSVVRISIEFCSSGTCLSSLKQP